MKLLLVFWRTFYREHSQLSLFGRALLHYLLVAKSAVNSVMFPIPIPTGANELSIVEEAKPFCVPDGIIGQALDFRIGRPMPNVGVNFDYFIWNIEIFQIIYK